MKLLPFLALGLWAVGALAVRAEPDDGPEVDPSLYFFPPTLNIEPLVPPSDPEDELDRDPNGVLVLPNVKANTTDGGCFPASGESRVRGAPLVVQ